MLKPNVIKGYRVMKGLTQQTMADKLHMNVKTYHKKENGKQDFSIYEARDLAKILGVSMEDIFFNI